MKQLNKKFYKNKKILITGHSGFLGSWLSISLKSLGAKLYGISKKNVPNQSLNSILNLDSLFEKVYYLDLSLENKLEKKISIKPDILIHLAAQPIVLDSYKKPEETYMVNVIATMKILKFIKSKNIKNVLFSTSDKVYQNLDNKRYYIESDKLAGDDIYSSSKSAQEILIKSFYYSFFKNKAYNFNTIRAGNIFGGGDFGKFRLIPDLAHSVFKNKIIKIRNLNSTRPWQYVMDVVNAILFLISKKNNINHFQSWNFGPRIQNVSVKKIISIFKILTNKKIKIIGIKQNLSEKKYLNLSSKKFHKEFGFLNKRNLETDLKETLAWYEIFYKKKHNHLSKFSNLISSNYFALKK